MSVASQCYCRSAHTLPKPCRVVRILFSVRSCASCNRYSTLHVSSGEKKIDFMIINLSVRGAIDCCSLQNKYVQRVIERSSRDYGFSCTFVTVVPARVRMKPIVSKTPYGRNKPCTGANELVTTRRKS